MSSLDFMPVGLIAQWPARKWLDFLEGPSAGPYWAARLGHANTSSALYVATYPLVRFTATMVRADDDPLREVAYSAMHSLINRTLFQAPVSGPRRGSLIRLLMHYAERQADDYLSWPEIRWYVDEVPSADREVPARTTSLAGWQTAFGHIADNYVTAISYGAALDGIRLGPISDPQSYGFEFDRAQFPANSFPDVPGNDASKELHDDLSRLLAGESPFG